MDMRENPNYYSVERPYKSKYICVKCRKTFKRRVLADITKDKAIQEKEPKCPNCGEATSWIGPKFRSPKSDNIKAWDSISVLHNIGALSFMGWASGTTKIPETKKSLFEMLKEMKENCLYSIDRWATMEYNVNNKVQIKYLSDRVKHIDTYLKKL